ncbi:hypothetical protein GCM10010358_45640 [Streptomyces minutiscleroticus]|uniref:Uncharacterized protein n=1 Tax=Streptomyces minutiscleroticus TaxID=68238 RepID=A0A918NPV8_9ACTN|nr:hypothetical protein GCM10010358_45640 [Streptomyces minutiscleroticus]
MSVQKNGRLEFPGVHVAEHRGFQARPGPRLLPVLHGGEKGHTGPAARGFLHHIAQHVIPAVAVDDGQGRDAGPAQRGGHVPYDGVQGDRGDADRPGPGRVLVGAGQGHRRKEEHRVGGGQFTGYRAGDERVRGQRQVRPVLLEAADREDGHAGPARPDVLGGVERQRAVRGQGCR